MRNKKMCAFVAAAVLGFTLPALAADQPWVTKSNENAKLLLGVMAKYSPEQASNLGVDGYDDKITDLSRDQYEPEMKDLRAAVAALEAKRKAETDPKVRQDLDIIITHAQDEMRSMTLNRKCHSST
jgi:hypothetical protein